MRWHWRSKRSEILGLFFRVLSSLTAERTALRKLLLLRWGAGAVGAVSATGGAVGGARFGALHVGEGRVPSRGY
jgi:hypothetical protein